MGQRLAHKLGAAQFFCQRQGTTMQLRRVGRCPFQRRDRSQIVQGLRQPRQIIQTLSKLSGVLKDRPGLFTIALLQQTLSLDM